MMWILISLLALCGFGIGVGSLVVFGSRLGCIQKLAGERRWLSRCIALLLVVLLAAVLYVAMDPVNMIIVMLHLAAVRLIVEGLFLLLKKYAKKKVWKYLADVVSLVAVTAYLCVGWYQCTHVWEKDYTLQSDKLQGNLRVVQITDSHIGATFDGKGLLPYIRQINALHPDVVVITGDFVDDGTTKEDMLDACRAIGELKTKDGVFFSYGNHDKGYASEEEKGWTNDMLLDELRDNNVTILQDESVLIDGRYYIVGRQDKSEETRGQGRKSPKALMGQLDSSLYKVVLDHQPCEYDKEAAAGANLVLSGHTHGGQLIPFHYMGEWTRQYERRYGHEKRGETDFIVSSGISDWELLFKTGCRSEYVVVDVKGSR